MRYKLSLHNLRQPFMKCLSYGDRRAQILGERFIAGHQIHGRSQNRKLPLAIAPGVADEYPPGVEADANRDGLSAERQRHCHEHQVLCTSERLCSEIHPGLGIAPDREHSVADELIHQAVVTVNDLGCRIQVGTQFCGNLLGRHTGGQIGEGADVRQEDHAIDIARLAIRAPRCEQAVCDGGRYVSAELREQHLLVAVSECALTGRLRQFCGELAQQVPAEGGIRKEQLHHLSRQYQPSNHALRSRSGASVRLVDEGLFADDRVRTPRDQMHPARRNAYLPMQDQKEVIGRVSLVEQGRSIREELLHLRGDLVHQRPRHVLEDLESRKLRLEVLSSVIAHPGVCAARQHKHVPVVHTSPTEKLGT